MTQNGQNGATLKFGLASSVNVGGLTVEGGTDAGNTKMHLGLSQ